MVSAVSGSRNSLESTPGACRISPAIVEEQESMEFQDVRQHGTVSISNDSDHEFPPLPDESDDLLYSQHHRSQPSSSLHLSDGPDATTPRSEGAFSVDELEMRRHLNDMESSFLPEVAPAARLVETVGMDDTYVNIGTPGYTPPLRSILGLPDLTSPAQESGRAPTENRSSATPADAYKTAAPERYEDPVESPDGTTPPESVLSSPAAAAAQRNHMRTVPIPSTRGESLRRSPSPVKEQSALSAAIIKSSSPLFSSQASTVRASRSPQPQDVSLPLSESESALSMSRGNSQASARPISQRPGSSYDRRISQRSSYSSQSAMSELSGSDVTLNADYALQTGGAIPGNSPLVSRASLGLSRLPSLGSVASELSRDDDAGMPSFSRVISGLSVKGGLRADQGLDILEEERNSSSSPPVTPRPTSQLAGITDTAIAQHVQNIHVPDTIAQEYRQQHRSYSPDKRPASSSNPQTFNGRPQSNLTLKEQNSKIDKLTKENFDLKLKIHFLDQALQNRSDEGVKDMISQNVQFQTDLANERKDNQSLRRKVRELERRLKDMEADLADARDSAANAQLEGQEEIEMDFNELRLQLDRCQVQITSLSAENLAKELEKRKMAEYVAAVTERKGNEQNAAEDEAEMWKDLLTTESTRREQAEEDSRKLREELIILRSEKATRDRMARNVSGPSRFDSRSISATSGGTNGRNGSNTASSVTMVEHLRHENAELRRDLGAQTSMLTSRNKERERLQQEIEDLKISQRRGDGARSVAGDSIFERSVSRARQRSASRASAQTGMTQFSEAEREQWERREGILRDQNAALRLDYQELKSEAQARIEEIIVLEEECQALQGELQAAVEDLQALQKERDDALQALEHRDHEYEKIKIEYTKLEDEAITSIEGLQATLEHTEAARLQLSSDLENRNEDFFALQQELRQVASKLLELEDDREGSIRRIGTLEQELEESSQELHSMDKKMREASDKSQRLEVQQESLHNEISFLREEQEGDKIKIGELEDVLGAAQQMVQDEKEKMQELEASLLEERGQREILDTQSKQDVQKTMDGLNAENAKNKDEVRRLRRGISTKETEAATWKSRLEELEGNLRRALGDLNGTRTSLLQHIERQQADIEKTVQQLDKAKTEGADKERQLRNRDTLLESTGLESRRLAELLEKERQARKHDLHQWEQAQRGQTTHTRTTLQHESRVHELETARTQDRRKMAQLEQQYREQLHERNTLLFALWTRLSTLCGTEWIQGHSLVNGEVPSAELISRGLPSFERNIVDAIRQIEGLIEDSKSRIRSVEKTLTKDYQTLEHNLSTRIARMDILERAVADAKTAIDAQASEQAAAAVAAAQQPSRPASVKATNSEELTKLKQEVKVLKAELQFHRQHPSPTTRERTAQDAAVSAVRRSGSVASTTAATATGRSSLSPRALASSLLRHHSTSAVETLRQTRAASQSSNANGGDAPAQAPFPAIATPPAQQSEQRWIHRLKEMERRLKAEREARLLDRRGARQRLEERSAENEELKALLEREKGRRESLISISEAGEAEGAAAAGGVSVGAGASAVGRAVEKRKGGREDSVD